MNEKMKWNEMNDFSGFAGRRPPTKDSRSGGYGTEESLSIIKDWSDDAINSLTLLLSTSGSNLLDAPCASTRKIIVHCVQDRPSAICFSLCRDSLWISFRDEEATILYMPVR